MAFSLDKVRDGINEFKTTIIYFSVDRHVRDRRKPVAWTIIIVRVQEQFSPKKAL